MPGTILQTPEGEDPAHAAKLSTHDSEPIDHAKGREQGSGLQNVAYFIDNKGEICGKYVKKNLWGAERSHLSSSGRDTHPVFDTPLGKVGMLICWDMVRRRRTMDRFLN